MKVLILGAGGYLGKVVYKKSKANNLFIVKGTHYSKAFEDTERLDILDTGSVRRLIDRFCPDVVLWCIYNKLDEVQLSNVGLSELLSAIKPETRLIYISTTLSPLENQDENTLPVKRSPDQYLAAYVNGKILGEQFVQKHPNHVIIRPGQIFGFGAEGEYDDRMRRIIEEIRNHDYMERIENSRISVIHVDELADVILELCSNEFVGTLCVAAEKPVSYYHFYRLLAHMIGVEESKMIPVISDSPHNDYYFNVSKAKALLRTVIHDV